MLDSQLPRWRILVPVSILLAWLQFGFYSIANLIWLPDFGLILLLWAIPSEGSRRIYYPFTLVLWLGSVRSGITALDPLNSWLGYALSLLFRHFLFRHFSNHSMFLRLLIGFLIAIPQVFFDFIGSVNLGDAIPLPILSIRCLCVALVCAWLARPLRGVSN